jgi:predicted acylesterase/phospholipase RssA
VSGASVGAINGAAIAQFAPGPDQLREAAKLLMATWGKLRRTEDVWRKRFPPYMAALYQPSIGTVEPLEKLLRATVDVKRLRASGVKLRMTSVDLLSGEARVHTEADADPVVGILASASFPGAFPPVTIGASYCTDGGVRDAAPLTAAVREGCDRALVICCRDPGGLPRITKDRVVSALDVAHRALDILTNEALRNDLAMIGRVNALVRAGGAKPGKRHVEVDVVIPSVPLGDPLDFDGAMLDRQIKQGYEDARQHFKGTS